VEGGLSWSGEILNRTIFLKVFGVVGRDTVTWKSHFFNKFTFGKEGNIHSERV
jgi:hypothetical protein